jgi:hypothetical protein
VSNSVHPEAEVDEVFLTNAKRGDSLDSSFYQKWLTRRPGRNAHNLIGEYLPDHFPVFVKRSDVEKNGGFVQGMGKDTFFR